VPEGACTRVKEKGPTPRMVEIEGVGLCTNRLHRLPLLMDLFNETITRLAAGAGWI
jgi:hypothetical protein